MIKPRKIFNIFLYVFAVIGLAFFGVFVSMQFGWLNVRGTVSERNSYFKTSPSPRAEGSAKKYTRSSPVGVPTPHLPWAQSEEWAVMKEAFTRDQDIIKKAASDAGVPARILLGGVIGEQFRFFTGKRDSFKSYFEPLKILASLSKFSFGIAGLKPQTVERIELQLKDVSSPFYLGAHMEHIANYDPSIVDVSEARMARITDAKNPYYSYLYVGLYMNQVIAQWDKAGFDISNRPDVLATLYNLGFYNSKPHAEPKAGGAEILVNGNLYTFGDLAYEFYYSSELSDIFPATVQ
ncbi:MAG: hypothetical protein WC059_01935 [Candidatus Paceibacterota bacterium]